MDVPTVLLRHLLDLSVSADHHRDDLGDRLTALVSAVSAAVPSYRGMHVTLVEGGQPTILSAFAAIDQAEIVTSLRLPFAALAAGFHIGSRVVFYAATRGAFVDLAADLGHAVHAPVLSDGCGTPIGERPDDDAHHRPDLPVGHRSIVLDADLPPATLVSGLTGLENASTINRAIGMLIEQGHHPDEAHATLHRHAAAAGVEAHIYAARLLRR